MMPGLEGPELCRRIRARDDGLYTYIILLTARDSRTDRLEGLEAGADDFLTKPVDSAELVARLNVARRILTMQGELRAQSETLRELHASVERQNARLAELATTDGLTGLKNRRHFNEALDAAVALSGRREQPLSLILLDVDHFKAYNDTFGHPAGDDALRQVALVLAEGVRAYDVAARYGGEEFAVLLPATNAHDALAVSERLRQAIASRDWPFRAVSASFGIATTHAQVLYSGQLVAEADRALYLSKVRGRNRVTHYHEMAESPVLERNGGG
jgi:diguanylate cyclase (GGDEF)-like protein